MKNLVNCENLEKILISEKMKCDALIISGQSLQYSLLYHSEDLKTFTDNIAKTIIYHFGRQTMINAIPKIINSNKYPNINLIELSSTLSKVNSAVTSYQLLSSTLDYIEGISKIKKVKKLRYVTFYSAKSDSLIMINQNLLSTSFDDLLQSKLDCTDLCGVYINQDLDYSLILYFDPLSTQFKLKLNSE